MPIIASIGAGSARGLGFTSGSAAADFDYLVLAGGGGGGVSPGGGGGAGGHRTSFPGGTKTTIVSGQTITVGGGGNGGYVPAGYIPGTRGGLSSSGDIESTGGGAAEPEVDAAAIAIPAAAKATEPTSGSGGCGGASPVALAKIFWRIRYDLSSISFFCFAAFDLSM